MNFSLTGYGASQEPGITLTASLLLLQYTEQHKWEECGPCPVFASYTLAFALQLRKKYGKKTSVRVAEECQLVLFGYPD